MATKPVRIVFNIPATLGEYADEVLEIKGSSAFSTWWEVVNDFTAIIEALPTAAVIEADYLRGGGDPDTEAHWILAQDTYEAVGRQPMVPLAAWYGVRFRGKSGGTDGEAILSVGRD